MNVMKKLAAGVLLMGAAVAAWAAGVTPAQLEKLQRGMSEEQVLALLGKPGRNVPLAGVVAGRSWLYATEGGSLINGTVIEVDFSEGRVVKITQRFSQDFH